MSASAASAFWVNPEKISSANALFEELYSMVYDNLCPIPNPPYAVRNVINDFFQTVRVVSLEDDEEEDIEGSYFFSGYHDSDAVFYPFQDRIVVEADVFLAIVQKWKSVQTRVSSYAYHIEDRELIENLQQWEGKFNLLTVF